MILMVNDIKVRIQSTRNHLNIGATFYWPNGNITYGEYRDVKEVLESLKSKTLLGGNKW
jgi:hypothetical protein